MSRRQFLKGLLALAFSGVLAYLGYGPRSDSAAEAQSGTTKDSLPPLLRPGVPTDDVTLESLLIAQTAVINGATDVPLTPGGTLRYRRTLSGGQVVHEEIVDNGNVVLFWDHDRGHNPPGSVGYFDQDRDGFFETRMTVWTGTDFADQMRETVEYNSAADPSILRRETIWRLDATTVHVIREQVDPDNGWVVTAEFDTTVLQPSDHQQTLPATSEAIRTIVPCNADDLTDFKNQMWKAIVEGVLCLRTYGENNAANIAMDAFTANKITFNCITGVDVYAQSDVSRYPAGPVVVQVNVDVSSPKNWYINQSGQTATLFHEMMHLMFPDHEQNTDGDPWYDRIYACEALCFTVDPDQCACTTCMQRRKCDDRCAPLKACPAGPNQCADQCCVGPCEGNACCPPSRICRKHMSSVTCCPEGYVCHTDPDGSEYCKASKFYCNCNQTCYDDVGTCLANCQVTLGCFTGICGPEEPGQCP